MSMFTPAVKAQMKARVALCGPTGSGKTWTALEWATVLAADGGRIALIDTERDSARLYANHFDFDVMRFDPPYEPARLVKALEAAAEEGYDVVVVDSFSHFWEGEGGVLDVVDNAAQRVAGNTFAGWKVGTPMQRWMVDTFLALPMHVIIAMRSKMDYALETDERGKLVPVKLGLAPVQRAGVEYEFTIVGDLDLEHRIVISKSRCDVLADQVIQPGRAADAAKTFAKWLDDGEPLPPQADPEEIEGFLARVRDCEPVVREAMNAWWKEQGFHREFLTVPQLNLAREKLEEITGSGDVGERPADPETEEGSAEPEGAPSSETLPDASEEQALAMRPCDLCGSTRARRVPVGDTVRCSNAKDCERRAEEARESA